MFIEAGSAHVVHKALTIRDLSKGLWLKHKIGEIQLWVNKSATSNGLNVKQPQAQHAQAGLHWELQSCDSLANWRSCPKFRTNSFRCSCLSMSQHVGCIYTYLHGYGSISINTIFWGRNIHLPAILMFTSGIRF